MEQAQQHRQDRAWVGVALEEALDTDSPILRSFRAGKLPALHDIVGGLLADLESNHRDREIVLLAAVYLMLGDLLLKVDPETSDRAEIVIACGELGHLGAWLLKSRPRTMRGARTLVHLAARILEARETGSGLALAQGPAEELLSLALDTLSDQTPSASRNG